MVNCYINMFSLNQQVVIDGKSYSIPTENLVDGLVGLCNEYSLNKVHLFGVEEYILQFATELSTNYANIEVEVN